MRASSAAGYASPTGLLTQEDMVSIHVASAEDLVKYEPSITIRPRYIADFNGALDLHGSNIFTTSCFMMFVGVIYPRLQQGCHTLLARLTCGHRYLAFMSCTLSISYRLALDVGVGRCLLRLYLLTKTIFA